MKWYGIVLAVRLGKDQRPTIVVVDCCCLRMRELGSGLGFAGSELTEGVDVR
jgi:hypothetical protein